MFSQSNEEEAILKFFGDRVGRFLDIGAYDGKTFSNTRALALRGWSGVCVEASPQCFVQLQKTYEGNPKVEVVSACVGKSSGLARFYDHGGATATTDREHARVWETNNGVKYSKIVVAQITGSVLLQHFGEKVDFISIDVEGANVDVMLTMPVGMGGADLVCIEADAKDRKDVIDVMGHRWFMLIQEFPLGGNLLFARRPQ